MPDLWDWGRDRGIWRDVDKVQRHLKELRVQNTKEDIQRWMNRCLWWASAHGQFAVCEHLVKQGGDPTWRYELSGFTAIHIAAWCNRSRVLQVLLDGGWSPNVTDIHGLTSLWLAGYKGHKDCVEILLSKGSNPLCERTQSNKNLCSLSHGVSCDDNPLVAATKRNHIAIIAMMQDIIKARCSVASAGGETAATMTDVSLTCQVQQLTSEVRSLSAVVAEKEEQIHSLERTVNDMQEVVAANGRQISFLSKTWTDVKKFFSKRDKPFRDVVPLADKLSPCVTEFPGPNKGCHKSSVVKFGADQFYSIGLRLGFSDAEIATITGDKVIPASKLEALIEKKRAQVGDLSIVPVLLDACRRIPHPIYHAVMADMN